MTTRTRLRPFFSGAKGTIAAWSFISKHKLWYFFLFPAFLHLFMAMGITALVREMAQAAIEPLGQWLKIAPLASNDWKDEVIHIWNSFSDSILQLFIWITGFFLYLKFAKYLLIALMAPAMAFMSEKTEEILTGKSFPFSLSAFVKNSLRGVSLALRNLFIELFLLAALSLGNLLVSLFLPPLAILTMPLSVLASTAISTYFLGFSTFDYLLERRSYSIQKSVAFARTNKELFCGNGSAFLLWQLIPFVGTSIGLVTATVGAVITFHEKEKIEING